jgi:hypothetical protein
MPKISPFQMTEAQSWSGLTTKNHLGAIYQQAPQMASKLMTRIHQTNFGLDLDSYLDRFDPLYLDTDNDFEWELIGSAKKNVPLVEARINGVPVTGLDQPGKNFTEFELVFPEQWFTDENIIVGEKNELYSMQIQADPTPEGTNNWVYKVKLITGDPELFVPLEELESGKRFSKDWSLVEQTLSKKGGGINFTSPFRMRNSFSMIRMQHTTPGNMIDRPFATKWRGTDGQAYTTWTQYEDYMFDYQFRQEKNRMLMFAHSNKAADGTYKNYGKSGHIKKQGAGIRQQMEASNTNFYNDFSIDYLIDILLDLSEGKLPGDQREFVMRTGERGAVQFHKAIEDNVQLFTPLQNTDRMYKASGVPGMNAKMPYGYGGQFVEYMGPNGVKVNLSIDSLYDDRERNKIYHPKGGVAESYRYDILDVGTNDGEPNIRKVYVSGQEDIMGYEPGLRHPFSRNGERHIMANSTDGYTMHRASICGAMVKDPSRTASIIPSILAC